MDEFMPGIERCWQNCPSEEQPNLVAAAFWAIVRCSSQRYGELLTKVLNVWQTIPERGATDREDPRHSIAVYELGQCSPKWMPDQVAQWLAGIVASYPGLAPQLDYLLSLVDAPLAFEYQVRKLAARKSRKGDVSWLSFILQSRWDTNRRHGHQISEPSRQRLHSIWSSPQEPLEEREYAFRYWVISATTAELVTLRTIGPNSHLYQFALRKRMQLRDRTTVNELRTCLLKNWNLLYDAPPVWSPDLQNVVIQLFRCRRGELRYDEAHTAAFLLSLTVEQAELLLVELWPDWGDIVWFQATALLLGTPKAKELVAGALNNPASCDSILDHAHFVMMGSWPYLNREELLPIWMDRCTPYLCRASQETLRSFIMVCRTPATWKWHERHIRPLLLPESRTDLDDRMQLTRLEARYRRASNQEFGACRFFEEVEERGLDKEEMLRRIASEARAKPSDENVAWLAACIGTAG